MSIKPYCRILSEGVKQFYPEDDDGFRIYYILMQISYLNQIITIETSSKWKRVE